jgi:hypothetical protein
VTRRHVHTLALSAAVAALAGCEKLTRERFEMIRVQMDAKADVEKLIGPADYKLPSQWHYERDDQHLVVRIDFDNKGVVARKQWIDAMHADWKDSQPPDEIPVRESTTIETHQSDE